MHLCVTYLYVYDTVCILVGFRSVDCIWVQIFMCNPSGWGATFIGYTRMFLCGLFYSICMSWIVLSCMQRRTTEQWNNGYIYSGFILDLIPRMCSCIVEK